MIDGAYSAVLFDLDGTLVDTAPDMVAVLQDMQRAHGRDPVAYEIGRNHVSNGAIGLLKLGFPEQQHTFMCPMHVEYLDRYEQRLTVESTLFPGLARLLEDLEAAELPWGIVTNKPERLTKPLLDALGLSARVACVVSGDTLPIRKPDPAPLIHACEIAGLDPASTIYVGDADRDIQAGRAAGMATIGVAYGYVTEDDDPQRWHADVIAGDTQELDTLLRKAVNL